MAAYGAVSRKSMLDCWDYNSELKQLKKACRRLYGEECFLAFYKDKNTPDKRIYTHPYDIAVKKIKLKREQITKRRTEQEQQKKLASWSEKCVAFGYELRSDKHKSCMLELYKLDNQPSITTNNRNNSDSGAVRALLEEQRKQRQLEGSLEMMKRGLEMMSPPKPKLNCRYNPITYTTVCN
jgi:hypothetical protein